MSLQFFRDSLCWQYGEQLQTSRQRSVWRKISAAARYLQRYHAICINIWIRMVPNWEMICKNTMPSQRQNYSNMRFYWNCHTAGNHSLHRNNNSILLPGSEKGQAIHIKNPLSLSRAAVPDIEMRIKVGVFVVKNKWLVITGDRSDRHNWGTPAFIHGYYKGCWLQTVYLGASKISSSIWTVTCFSFCLSWVSLMGGLIMQCYFVTNLCVWICTRNAPQCVHACLWRE